MPTSKATRRNKPFCHVAVATISMTPWTAAAPSPTALRRSASARTPTRTATVGTPLRSATVIAPAGPARTPSRSALMRSPSRAAASGRATPARERQLEIGDMVRLEGSDLVGVLRYLGPVHGRDGFFAGLELTGASAGRGKNDGTVHGYVPPRRSTHSACNTLLQSQTTACLGPHPSSLRSAPNARPAQRHAPSRQPAARVAPRAAAPAH